MFQQPLLQWEKQFVLHITRQSVCSIMYLSGSARVRHIVICNLLGFTVFLHFISRKVRFSKKKN